MGGMTVLILFFALIFLGVPVAYTMVFSAGLYFITNDMSLMVLIQKMGGSLNSITMLAVPTFIFAGCLMNNGGLSDALFKSVLTTRIGKIKGGLAHINVVCSLIFAGMSGAALADLGGLGQVEMKAMRENGYDDDDSIAVTLASSAIGPIFPPSIPMLMYALVASVSGVKILLAGIVPGILLMLVLMAFVAYLAKKKNFPYGNIHISRKEKVKLQLHGVPALLAPVILLAGLLSGTYSPTELACVAVVYSVLVGCFFYKGLSLKKLIASASETSETMSNTLFILCGASAFAFVLTMEQVPQTMQALITSVTTNKVLLILMVNFILLIVGMVMDTGISIIIFTPIFLPIMKAVCMDPLQLGVMICLNLVIGLYTPPFGTCLFMASTMTQKPFERIVKAITPYYIPLLAVLLLVAFIPPLTTWLPNLFF